MDIKKRQFPTILHDWHSTLNLYKDLSGIIMDNIVRMTYSVVHKIRQKRHFVSNKTKTYKQIIILTILNSNTLNALFVRTKGIQPLLTDPTQVESKNTIVKSNGLSRVLMLN